MTDILLPAFIMSLILLGIHSYFGIRIIQRNIIFTDLAIGQMAAFGAAISLFFLEGNFHYVVSVAFALLTGLAIFYVSRKSKNLEAVIGLIYALGISGVFILLSKSPHGMEEFQNLMAYDILFTQVKDIVTTGIIYAIIGLIIFTIIRKTKGNLNELLFFVTFAVTVTSSVKMAGVLVVFAILLAPAFIAIQLTMIPAVPSFIKKFPLLTAWSIGTIINMISIVISYYGDMPTGYTIVFCNAFLAIMTSLVAPNFFGNKNHKNI
jgi:zinc/manganese transport system permease protein